MKQGFVERDGKLINHQRDSAQLGFAGMFQKCTNPELEFVLLKEVALAKAKKRSPQLSPELEQHLRECERCRRMLPEWVERLATWDQPPEKPETAQ